MRYLANGNTDFKDSVTRGFPHFQSGPLKEVLTALTECQRNPNHGPGLAALSSRLTDWIEEHPKESRTRGSQVQRLHYELEVQAASLRYDIQTQVNAFKVATKAWGTRWTLLGDIEHKIKNYSDDWAKIDITDRPTGVAGQYTFTAGNAFSEGDRNVAIKETTEGGGAKEKEPAYWIRLGRRVLTPQSDGKCYGRCFSCAAAVIYSLVTDGHFDDYVIEHVGATAYDHHLVLLGRPNASGADDAGLNEGTRDWMRIAVVIDVWQGNLDGSKIYSSPADMNTYAQGDLRWFCAYPRGPQRNLMRRTAQTVLPPGRSVAVKTDILDEAKKAVQEQGNPTRNVKENGKWVIQELVDGNWVTK